MSCSRALSLLVHSYLLPFPVGNLYREHFLLVVVAGLFQLQKERGSSKKMRWRLSCHNVSGKMLMSLLTSCRNSSLYSAARPSNFLFHNISSSSSIHSFGSNDESPPANCTILPSPLALTSLWTKPCSAKLKTFWDVTSRAYACKVDA